MHVCVCVCVCVLKEKLYFFCFLISGDLVAMFPQWQGTAMIGCTPTWPLTPIPVDIGRIDVGEGAVRAPIGQHPTPTPTPTPWVWTRAQVVRSHRERVTR